MFRVIEASGRTLELPVAASGSLAANIWLSGETPPPALCSGLGRCGACRVRFREESAAVPDATDKDGQVLGPDAVAAGWRLACRHRPAPGMVVELPPVAPGKRTRLAAAALPLAKDSLRLAVDLGTTSVHWRILAGVEKDGALSWLTAGEGQCLNPQMGAGSDVVSRLAASAAPEGRRRLRELVLRLLRSLTDEAAQRWGEKVGSLCVAGNTAMTAILLDADTSGLAGAPYRLPHAGGVTVSLPGLPPVWIPPQPAPFVGGDVSAGMARLLYGGREAAGGGTTAPKFPFLLADLGTNGEFVLALDRERSFIASVPLGPSLEGIGLSCGGVAGPGRVDRFTLGPAGLTASFIDGRPETGGARICGTGYLSLLECLLRAGLLDASGRLSGAPPPLAVRLMRSVERKGNAGWRLSLPDGLFLTAEDVEEILKVKAAFSLALERLLEEAGLASAELARVELGGALGEHVPVSALETLGFLPPGLGGRVHGAGNTSLAGAAFLLEHPEWRDPLVTWSRNCVRVGLAEGPAFTKEYMRHMAFGSV